MPIFWVFLFVITVILCVIISQICGNQFWNTVVKFFKTYTDDEEEVM